jgi:hypothetical protein
MLAQRSMNAFYLGANGKDVVGASEHHSVRLQNLLPDFFEGILLDAAAFFMAVITAQAWQYGIARQINGLS